MPKPKFKYSFDYIYKGLPCILGVYEWEDYHHDWIICDRKGYRADWLSCQLSKDDCYAIHEFLCQRIEGD